MWEQIQTDKTATSQSDYKTDKTMAALTPMAIIITSAAAAAAAAAAAPRRRGLGRAYASAGRAVSASQAVPVNCPKTFYDGLCVCVLKFEHPSATFDHAFFAGLSKAVCEILIVAEIAAPARVRAHFCDGDIGQAYLVLMTK